jgi:Cu/Ag efflux protein CusF
VSPRGRFTLALLAIATAALAPCGCSKKQAEPADAQAPTAEYTVRGRIEGLPDPARPASALQIHHEPIPEFKSNWANLPDGMNEMSMSFPLAPGVALDGLKIGDAVEFTFSVRYDATSGSPAGYHVVRIAALPPGTSLQIKE